MGLKLRGLGFLFTAMASRALAGISSQVSAHGGSKK
jgi:hypothetical protein